MTEECKTCSWGEMAANAAGSFAQLVKHAATKGEVLATRAVREARLAVCSGCEFKDSLRCRACGCFLNLKTGLVSEICPKGRW
jgi:hypothetical protein